MSQKLNCPIQRKIYKIIGRDKNGFSFTVLCLTDGSKRQVLWSNLQQIDLNQLEWLNFATPGLYNILEKFTSEARHKYVGPSHRPVGCSCCRQMLTRVTMSQVVATRLKAVQVMGTNTPLLSMVTVAKMWIMLTGFRT